MKRGDYPGINSEYPRMDVVTAGFNTEFARLDTDFNTQRSPKGERNRNLKNNIEFKEEEFFNINDSHYNNDPESTNMRKQFEETEEES